MFIKFRKSGIAGIISKCAYCILLTGTILFFINKSDDVFSRQMWSVPVTSTYLCLKDYGLLNIYQSPWGNVSANVLLYKTRRSLFCTYIHRFLPDLISIWHFGVWKYGPDSPSVFYRLWKHTHKDKTTFKTTSLLNPLIISQNQTFYYNSLWVISPLAKRIIELCLKPLWILPKGKIKGKRR